MSRPCLCDRVRLGRPWDGTDCWPCWAFHHLPAFHRAGGGTGGVVAFAPADHARPPLSAAPLVTVPGPPPLALRPRWPRAVVTVAHGPEGEELLAVSGPLMAAYAARLRADFVVLDWPGPPAWPMGAKFGIGRALEHYARVLYADADVLFMPGCPNLFGETPAGHWGGYDDRPYLTARRQAAAVLDELTGLRVQQGLGYAPPPPWYLNTGVFVCDRAHRGVLAPPAGPIPASHLSEQHLFNARLLDAGGPVRLLDRACNYQWWTDAGFTDPPRRAVLHFSGLKDHAERVRQMRRFA